MSAASHMDNYHLVQACIAGDEPARQEFIDRFGGIIVCVWKKRIAPFRWMDRDEFISEVWLKVAGDGCRVLKAYLPRCGFEAWFSVVVNRFSIDLIRKRMTLDGREFTPTARDAETTDFFQMVAAPGDEYSESETIMLIEELAEDLDAGEKELLRWVLDGAPVPVLREVMGYKDDRTVYKKREKLFDKLRERAVWKEVPGYERIRTSEHDGTGTVH